MFILFQKLKAQELNRKYLGCDINEEAIKITENRLKTNSQERSK